MNSKVPGFSHLKIFGCKEFPLIVNKNRNMFVPTAQQNCVMAGYNNRESIYWIYNKSKRTMLRSHGAKFNEEFDLRKEKDNTDNYSN